MNVEREHRGGVRGSRREFLVAAAAGALAAATGARAAETRGPTRFLVGFGPGGTSDRVARAIAPPYARVSGRDALVENVPGANGARAMARTLAADPDGGTILVGTSGVAHPDHAAAMGALRPVIQLATTPMMLVVRATLPVRDPAGFVRHLKEHPTASYGSAGEGNPTHLCSVELLRRLGLTAVHAAYTGGPAALRDLLGGHIDFLMTGATATLLQQTGARVLAVTSVEPSRLPGIGHLPTIAGTIAEGFEFTLWQALYVPALTDDALVREINARCARILEDAEVRAALAAAGAEVVGGSSDAAGRVHREEAARFRRILAAGRA
ncbi:MAG: tripartite tricarboxylate transporter substrate binding protein [Burkholderiales bacterium]|nr:tripartite tricarboxylate transporter substrate binding protein [Burkholderiales bacterium]